MKYKYFFILKIYLEILVKQKLHTWETYLLIVNYITQKWHLHYLLRISSIGTWNKKQVFQRYYWDICQIINHQVQKNLKMLDTFFNKYVREIQINILQWIGKYRGSEGKMGFFDLALRERNIQVRLYLKVVLKFWDVDILIIRTNFQKSNIGWPQQPPTEKVQKLKKYISWFH